jgi:uncharacterized protein (TIGR03066 family)
MKTVKLLAVALVLCLIGSAVADENTDNARLAVGTWEVTKSHEGGPPKDGVVEFTKDGKIKVSGEQNGMKVTFDGKYKIDGKKMTLTFKIGEKEQDVELTIDKLDEKTFASSSKEGKVELTRKKK